MACHAPAACAAAPPLPPHGTTPPTPQSPHQPILLPRLRIQFADFPYLRSSTSPEAAHLGDLMRISVRPPRALVERKATNVSRAGPCALLPASAKRGTLPACAAPSLRMIRLVGPRTKVNGNRHLPPEHAPAWLVLVRVATLGLCPCFAGTQPPRRGHLGIKTELAFGVRLFDEPLWKGFPTTLASIHSGRTTLPRKPFSLRQASGISLEYLLLSPRSAPGGVPAGTAPSLRNALAQSPPASAYSRGCSSSLETPPPGTSTPLSAIHFRGYFIRRVSCYALLRRFQLPWPRPRCLHKATLFLVSDARGFRRFCRGYWFIPHRQSCLPRVAH